MDSDQQEMCLHASISRLVHLEQENEKLKAKIEEHNKECSELCGDKKQCGYERYDRSCPYCPKEWMIEV